MRRKPQAHHHQDLGFLLPLCTLVFEQNKDFRKLGFYILWLSVKLKKAALKKKKETQCLTG